MLSQLRGKGFRLALDCAKSFTNNNTRVAAYAAGTSGTTEDCHLKDCGAYAVYVADPKAIRDHDMLKKMDERSKRDGAVERPYVKLTLDNSLLCELAKARQEVGDGSEPEFNWVIGKAGSLLDYKLVGVHTCISGSTSVCDSGAFERMKDGSAPSAGDKHLAKDFLMVGEMPNCSSAAVYVLKSGEGFMIASNYEALDDDRGDLM